MHFVPSNFAKVGFGSDNTEIKRAVHPPPLFLFSIIFFYVPAIKVAVGEPLILDFLSEPAKNL